MLKIGITGGIGAGKSFVASEIEKMGYPIFYSDDIARWLMENDEDLIYNVKKEFGDKCYKNFKLQKDVLRKIVFVDKDALNKLNKLAHPVLKKAFDKWCSVQKSGLVFMESAILFETGSDKHFDETILVFAPESIRIDRIIKRDNCLRKEALNKINSQWPASKTIKLADHVVTNENRAVALSQLKTVMKKIKKHSINFGVS